MPGSYNLTIYRGDTGRWDFVLWADDAKTVPSDLTGVTAAAEIRTAPGGTVITSLACTITLPNIVHGVLSPANSALLKPGPASWDLQLTYPGGVVVTVLAGSVSVIVDVTAGALLATKTIGNLVTEARQILNDEIPISGSPRFPDADLITALNEGVLQIRAKRPDAWLRYGLRNPTPIYALPTDNATMLPFEDQFYSPLLMYVVGRSELTEDTFSEDGRAVALMSKFTNLLLKVAS